MALPTYTAPGGLTAQTLSNVSNYDYGTSTAPTLSTPTTPTATTGTATPATLGGATFDMPTPAAVAAPSGSSFTQGAPLPNITTSQQQQTIAPSFYTDYLNNLAKQGATAAAGADYVGATPLQTAAFNNVASNVGNYGTALQDASNLASGVGNADIAGNVNKYMNPYTQNVVNSLGNLGQQQIANFLAPQATAASAGSGQFGSSRGAAALGNAINQGMLNTQGLQSQALQTGYTQALQAAQNEAQQKLAASNQLGNLASTTQNLGLADVNALATLGEQQRTIAQNAQLFPMQQLTNESQLLKGYTIPTAVSNSYTGPIPGAYQSSPLQQIAGIGTIAAGIGQTDLGKYLGGALTNIGSGISDLLKNTGTTSYAGVNANGVPVYWNSKTGGYTDSSGNAVAVTGD
jgi:hypothetical protein